MKQWQLLLGCAFGNPWIYLTVFVALTEGSGSYQNPFSINHGGNVSGLSLLGLLIHVAVCLALAAGLIWLKHRVFRWHWPDGDVREYLACSKKALLFYGIGLIVDVMLVFGTEGNIIGFILFPIMILVALVLFALGFYDLIWGYGRRADAAAALDPFSD